ncbi:NAD-dependent epimerase/dehydratase family protein [bacterium]|nr:NAD-dependent epimerase/dehydratase family protein [bacterium]
MPAAKCLPGRRTPPGSTSAARKTCRKRPNCSSPASHSSLFAPREQSGCSENVAIWHRRDELIPERTDFSGSAHNAEDRSRREILRKTFRDGGSSRRSEMAILRRSLILPTETTRACSMPKVLVIAGTSFIGRHVCEHLCETDCDVVATSRRKTVGGGHDTTFCELTNADSVKAVIRDVAPDWIIQCGGATSSRDPRELYRTHVDGTLNVIEAAKQLVPEASLCIFGSAAEYGPVSERELPVSEDCPCRPMTFFGASKLAQTYLAQAAAATNGQKIVIVRPFNVIGPGLPDFYFASSLARRLLKLREEHAPPGTSFDIFNADSTRDFIDVRDVARAVTALLVRLEAADPTNAESTGVTSGPVFNLATGVETSLLDVATLLGDLAGGFVPHPAGQAESRGGISRSVGDASKLKSVRLPLTETSGAASSCWQPEFDWYASIRDLWNELSVRS